MSLGAKLRAALGRNPTVRVQILIRGRIGDGWYDVDESVRVPEGATLHAFVEWCDKRRIPLREALENSPHLEHTLMWNGQRAPLAEHGERVLQDGDELYLLAPIAGG